MFQWAIHKMKMSMPVLAILTALVPVLLPGPAMAQGRRSGETARMRVEFLYAIEGVGGRGDRLRSPRDISYDRKAGELYIADAGRKGVLIYDRNGLFQQELPVDRNLGSAMKVATDHDGRIYVGYNRSKKITVMNFRGETIGSYELPGIVDMPSATVRPMFLATGPEGKVLAMKSSGGLVEIDPFGVEHREIATSGENPPTSIYGMAVDPGGRILFSNMRPAAVVRYDVPEERFTWIGTPGQIYGQLSRPQGVAVDDAGHIFVSSLVRNKVLCYGSDGKFIEEFGGIGRDYGRFYMPGKIVSDGSDRLFVLEPALRRVQVFRITFPAEEK